MSDTCGDPPGPYDHAQNFPDAGSVLELMTLVCELETATDPGADCDTIIVNNDVGFEPGNRYLESLDGQKTFAGVFKVLRRDNFGTSLGGYNHAFEQFADRYEYWTFTEDDILINGPGYLRTCIDTFTATERCGFVAIEGLSKSYVLHAHAGVGLSHVSVLNAVRNLWGSLPHRRSHESQSDHDHTLWGEVFFTHLIERLGYTVVAAPSNARLYAFAYDYIQRRRGRTVPRRHHSLLSRGLKRLAHTADEWAAQVR